MKPKRTAALLAAALALAAAAPVGAQAYVGRWMGTVTQAGTEVATWSVVMDLGPLGGSIRFPTRECGGSLSRLRAGASPIFGELLEYGRDRCTTGLRVRLSEVTATSLSWEEIDAGGTVQASGTLTRTGPPPRNAETAGGPR